MVTASAPASHRRVVVHELGETPEEAIERFVRLEPQAVPTRASLGPKEVAIAIRSASVGWVDLLMTSGQYQHMAKLPYTPGLEYAGVVFERGSDVGDELPIGREILVDPFLAGPRSLGAYQGAGGWASFAVVPAHATMPLPRGMSFDAACNLLGNYETAYHCLLSRGRLQAGETVLIHGASGATGLAAVQIAKILGATVIATGRSEAKLRVVQENGADHVLSLAEEAGGLSSLRERVRELTNGRGVEVVYDGVGGPLSAESLRCVAFGARFLIVGWASTPFVAKGKGGRGAPNVNTLPTNLILMKGVDVLGAPTAIATAQDPRIRAPRLQQILAWAEEGKLRPHVSHTFDLDDFQAAMRAKWGGSVVGGAVLHPWRGSTNALLRLGHELPRDIEAVTRRLARAGLVADDLSVALVGARSRLAPEIEARDLDDAVSVVIRAPLAARAVRPRYRLVVQAERERLEQVAPKIEDEPALRRPGA